MTARMQLWHKAKFSKSPDTTTPFDQSLLHFCLCWKVSWSDLTQHYSTTPKRFHTVWNNTVFRWEIQVHRQNDSNVGVYLQYEDGPMYTIDGVVCALYLGNSELYYTAALSTTFVAVRTVRNCLMEIGSSHSNDFKEKYRITNLDSFYFRISLKLPAIPFSSIPQLGVLEQSSKKYQRQETTSNVKLISSDGETLECDKGILECNSEIFTAMFRHPLAKDQEEGVYSFPTIRSIALRTLVDCVVTGRANLTDLTLENILEIADAAEQYDVKMLKHLCAVSLWDRAVEKPEDCFIVGSFCDLHADFKYVKDRVLAMLASNYETLVGQHSDLKEKFGGGSVGDRLVADFNLFLVRKVEPCFYAMCRQQSF